MNLFFQEISVIPFHPIMNVQFYYDAFFLYAHLFYFKDLNDLMIYVYCFLNIAPFFTICSFTLIQNSRLTDLAIMVLQQRKDMLNYQSLLLQSVSEKNTLH